MAERTYKPGSVASACQGRQRRATISLRRRLPATSSSRPGSGTWTGSPGLALRPDSSLLGLAPDGVYQARPVTRPAGELLPHRFTLTDGFPRRRFAFCCTFPDLTAGGRYPPSCPEEPGLSSASRAPDSPKGTRSPWRRPPGPLRLARRHSNLTDRRAWQGPANCGNAADSWKACRRGDKVFSRQGTPIFMNTARGHSAARDAARLRLFAP